MYKEDHQLPSIKYHTVTDREAKTRSSVGTAKALFFPRRMKAQPIYQLTRRQLNVVQSPFQVDGEDYFTTSHHGTEVVR
jgi:hypothetical protein